MTDPGTTRSDAGGWDPAEIQLDAEAKAIGGKLEDTQVASVRADIKLRIGMAVVVAVIFIGLNWALTSSPP